MSFDTALLNLVGAGLGVVGCHLCKVSDRSIRQSNPAELVEFLSREGCGRQLALLAQEVVRPLVGFYRADPDRVVRHLQQTAALLPDRAFAGEAPLLAAWNRILGERNEGAAATHDIGTPCEQLADAILQQPRRVGLMTRSDLDDSLVHTILKAVLRPLAEDGAHFVALRPAFEKFVAQRARQRAKAAVMAGPAVGASADRTVQARLETARKDIERTSARAGVPVPMLSAVAADLVTAGAREDDLALWLDRKVAEFRDLDARLSRPADFDAAVATLRAQAAAALASGRLDLADLLLTQAEDVDIAASRERVEIATRHVQQASETRMLRGALAELRGHYRLSATHCAAAAGHLPVDDFYPFDNLLTQGQVLLILDPPLHVPRDERVERG